MQNVRPKTQSDEAAPHLQRAELSTETRVQRTKIRCTAKNAASNLAAERHPWLQRCKENKYMRREFTRHCEGYEQRRALLSELLYSPYFKTEITVRRLPPQPWTRITIYMIRSYYIMLYPLKRRERQGEVSVVSPPSQTSYLRQRFDVSCTSSAPGGRAFERPCQSVTVILANLALRFARFI